VSEALLEVHQLDCAYARARRAGRRGAPRTIVHDVDFTIGRGETLALVGESGSGKTTIARAIAGLLTPRRGQILFEGHDIGVRADRRPRRLRREIQYVFQNPDSSLNPRRRVGWTVGRPLELFFGLSRKERDRKVAELLEDVHLDSSYMRRLPTQLSGGERQRVAIARALAAEPKLVLCDEVVSALDVSVQANILDLLRELQLRRRITYVFIAHDLAVVRWLAHRVVVLYGGRVLEVGAADEVFAAPVQPYTEMLLSSVPEVGVAITDDAEEPTPTALAASDGCPFSPLCPRRVGAVCDSELPPWQVVTATHALRCQIAPAELDRLQQLLIAGNGVHPEEAGCT
jgi:peptide/nickel transport system ATP-binding protein